MGGHNPLSFIPFHKGADKQSNGQTGTWVQSWWLSKKRMEFGGLYLGQVTKNNMFKLRNFNFKAACLWMIPLSGMEVAMELLCEDHLAHPQWPHVFFVPRLMTHLWRKDLMKSADLFFTVPAHVSCWTTRQFEPLIVVIVLPLAHAPSYTGPWLVRGTHKEE